MPPLPFPNSSSPGERLNEGGGRLINCYTAQMPEGSRASTGKRYSPGILAFADPAADNTKPIRGMIGVGTSLYVAQGDKVYKITSAGVVTALSGTIGGTGPCYFARNNKTPVPDVLLVNDASVYTVSTTAVAALNDPDLPQPVSIYFQDGYFFCPISDGRVFASGLNNTAFAALDVATAESNPDGLYAAVPLGRALYLMGPHSVEVWQNTGQATGFPYTRAEKIQRGLVGPLAVGGYQDGWVGTVVFVADDNHVYRLSGYQIDQISTPEVARSIAGTTDKTAIEVIVYTSEGQAFAAIVGPDWTWEYNVSTGFWNERKSYGHDNWRAARSCFHFDKWFVGDRYTSKIGSIGARARLEYDQPVVCEAISMQLTGYPNRARLGPAYFDITLGLGDLTNESLIYQRPVVEIRWSKDGGLTWGSWQQYQLGQQGAGLGTIAVQRPGMASRIGVQAHLRCSDPVHFCLSSASIGLKALR